MRVKSRDDLDTLSGVRRIHAPKQDQIVEIKQEGAPIQRPDDSESLKAMHGAIASLADQVGQAVKIITDTNVQQVTSKQMEATIHRDANGRMERVTINVVKQE